MSIIKNKWNLKIDLEVEKAISRDAKSMSVFFMSKLKEGQEVSAILIDMKEMVNFFIEKEAMTLIRYWAFVGAFKEFSESLDKEVAAANGKDLKEVSDLVISTRGMVAKNLQG